VFFNLVVSESESLETIFESSLCSSNFRKEIHSFRVIRESLFDVIIGKVNDWVTIGPNQAPNAVRENDFTFTRAKEPLNFHVFSSRLFSKNITLVKLLIVVLLWEKHHIVFFIILHIKSLVSLWRMAHRHVHLFSLLRTFLDLHFLFWKFVFKLEG
jgi:hypothetical protein